MATSTSTSTMKTVNGTSNNRIDEVYRKSAIESLGVGMVSRAALITADTASVQRERVGEGGWRGDIVVPISFPE